MSRDDVNKLADKMEAEVVYTNLPAAASSTKGKFTMKAKITTSEHDNAGTIFPVIEILNDRIVCLKIGDRKVDFGISEIAFVVDASLGCEILFKFRSVGDSLRRASNIRAIAARAAPVWNLKICDGEKAINRYLFP
jgi:homoserine acetyltransferase